MNKLVSKLWTVYISEAEKYDKALVEGWKPDMEGLLIFVGSSAKWCNKLMANQAGLFSASLTALLSRATKLYLQIKERRRSPF
jgi:hypothetical protein